MDATTLLITVYCLIDDWLAGVRLRRRGPQPILSDSKVLTIECVGEFLGIGTDKGLYEYFRRDWGDWFPALGRIHRTTFVRQAANLWALKAQLRQQLFGQVSFDPAISILDSIAMPVCRFGRAYRFRRLADRGVWLLAPPSRSASRSVLQLPSWVTRRRRRIETVIGQLVERYHAKRVWARDAWHLWSRWQRKLLSHTLAVYLCQQHGLGSLRFADLLGT
jgi:hypothetical protein